MELDPAAWGANWAWGIPLIMLTTVVHVLGLGLISERIVRTLQHRMDHRRFTWLFAVAMSVVILLATLLYAFEAALWAVAYLLLGAQPNSKSAMLYSLSAHELRPRQCLSHSALADVGGTGVAQRDAAVRTHHGLSLRHDPTSLAARQPATAPARVTSRWACRDGDRLNFVTSARRPVPIPLVVRVPTSRG
jgi:hypothetical protein